MKIKTVPNANEKLKTLLSKKEINALYLSVKEKAEKGQVVVFTLNMQALVTQIALAVSEIVVEKPKIKPSTFLNSISYLGNKIIKNSSFERHWRATNINDSANNVKHTIKGVDVEIDSTLFHYNKMIDELSSAIGLNNFIRFKIKKGESKNLFGEKSNLKYENLAGNKVTFNLIPSPKIDKFSKTLSYTLEIKTEELTSDNLNVKILCKDSNRNLGSKTLSFKKNKLNSFKISFLNDEVKNNRLNILILVKVNRNFPQVKERVKSYLKGFFIFRVQKFYKEKYNAIVSKTILEKKILMSVYL